MKGYITPQTDIYIVNIEKAMLAASGNNESIPMSNTATNSFDAPPVNGSLFDNYTEED